MWRSPAFSLTAVIALALGIGANSTIFSVVSSVLLRPLPYRDSGRLVIVWENSLSQGWNRIGPSGPDFVDFKEQTRSFEDLAALDGGTGTLTGFGEPQQVPGVRVSNNYLSLLGIKPAAGRDFLPHEAWENRVGIMSYSAWQRYFGGDPGAIGKRILVDGLPYTLIGILPRDFWSPIPCDVLAPWSLEDLRRQNRMAHRFGVIGRLKRGVSPRQASGELAALMQRIGEQFPRMKGWGVSVVPMQQALTEHVRAALLILLGAVGFVLLIACANLANLLLARASARSRESAIRLALGAGRFRVVRQFLTESTLIALLGGGLGLLLAWWGVSLFEAILPTTLRLSDDAGEVMRPHIAIDRRVLAFTFLVSVTTGILFGLAPALAASRTRIHEALKEGGRTISGSGRLRSLLVVSEVALAVVLLICSGLTIKSFWRIRQVQPGFHAERVLAMETELPTDSKYRQGGEQAEFFRRVLEQVATLPGVRSAGITSSLPLDPNNAPRVDFAIEGRPLPSSGQLLPADFRAVSANYFAAMGIPLRRGRAFSESDKADRPRVAVIDETLATRYWPEGNIDPIGQRLRIGRSVLEIVGIVAAVRSSGLDRQPSPTIYVSYLQAPEFRMTLVVHTAGDPLSMVRAVKTAIYAVDKDQPVYKIRSMEQAISDSQAAPLLTLILLGIFAAVALALASVGIYGVISYAVAQRTHEIGIRVALGAGKGDILRLMAAQGMLPAALGLLLGLAGAFGLTRLLATLLYGISARDPLVFFSTAAVLGGVALLASYIPARKAAALDPIVSLRYE